MIVKAKVNIDRQRFDQYKDVMDQIDAAAKFEDVRIASADSIITELQQGGVITKCSIDFDFSEAFKDLVSEYFPEPFSDMIDFIDHNTFVLNDPDQLIRKTILKELTPIEYVNTSPIFELKSSSDFYRVFNKVITLDKIEEIEEFRSKSNPITQHLDPGLLAQNTKGHRDPQVYCVGADNDSVIIIGLKSNIRSLIINLIEALNIISPDKYYDASDPNYLIIHEIPNGDATYDIINKLLML